MREVKQAKLNKGKKQMEKITEIATNIQNGNFSTARQQIELLKPIEVLNLVEEYNLLTGLPFGDCVGEIKSLLKD